MGHTDWIKDEREFEDVDGNDVSVRFELPRHHWLEHHDFGSTTAAEHMSEDGDPTYWVNDCETDNDELDDIFGSETANRIREWVDTH